jgi:hypothetical protein
VNGASSLKQVGIMPQRNSGLYSEACTLRKPRRFCGISRFVRMPLTGLIRPGSRKSSTTNDLIPDIGAQPQGRMRSSSSAVRSSCSGLGTARRKLEKALRAFKLSLHRYTCSLIQKFLSPTSLRLNLFNRKTDGR